jgi:hypothetical protein
MLSGPAALWRVDEAATQMLFAGQDEGRDRENAGQARQLYW